MRQTSKSDLQKQAAPVDPDVFVPEKPPVRPTVAAKNADNGKNGSPPQELAKRPTPPSPPAKFDELGVAAFDPDAYVADSLQTTRTGEKNAVVRSDKKNERSLSLRARLRIYQSEKVDATQQTALENEFISESREAILTIAGLNDRSQSSPQNSGWLDEVGTLLWNRPFTDYLDLQQQALTTLSERPTAVVLAAMTPSAAMRADLRRTLARHWPEGPKAIRAVAAADYPLAEPGFIAVLKSLIRENQTHPASKPQAAKLAPIRSDLPYEDEPRKTSPDSEWNNFLEELVRDYCRRCHLASLAQSAAAVRDGDGSSRERLLADSLAPPLPGGEKIAAHRFQWPGENASRLSQAAQNGLLLDYQRFEKRMKLGRPLLFYRRQLESCIERSLANGVWLDGFNERRGEDRVRSVDVLVTWPKTRALKSTAEELELTVEILCVEVKRNDG